MGGLDSLLRYYHSRGLCGNFVYSFKFWPFEFILSTSQPDLPLPTQANLASSWGHSGCPGYYAPNTLWMIYMGY